MYNDMDERAHAFDSESLTLKLALIFTNKNIRINAKIPHTHVIRQVLISWHYQENIFGIVPGMQ